MKKVIVILAMLIGLWLVWAHTYEFDHKKASAYMSEHTEPGSIHCCAWYTMRGLHAGVCPAIILPAQWYCYFMPLVGWKEISSDGYVPQKGDIVVFERPTWRSWKRISSWWGHIAMYDGHQWVSDFKQKSMNPYKKYVPYKLYRFENKENR